MAVTLEPQSFGSVDNRLNNVASSSEHMKADGPAKLTGLPSRIKSQRVLGLTSDLRRIWESNQKEQCEERRREVRRLEVVVGVADTDLKAWF